MNIPLPHCTVRSWERRDAASLALYADDREIWRTLRDAFPSPYTLRHARRFIAEARRMRPERQYAIAVDGEAVVDDPRRIGKEPLRKIAALTLQSFALLRGQDNRRTKLCKSTDLILEKAS